MNTFLVQWIEEWCAQHREDDTGMQTLLAWMRKSSRPELLRVQHGSDMMERV
eukprot:CAMPEP_0202723136 /NCGR_PEP_ID=MMETSP1385-20130828/163526_1 /ASSEMBLY_ACC=CAM_ASM_000861 /TAXON_ID=933848 /ORGANISM="Elphidium margaritaceum" /LENGTH=51 /DNA_ID=CAMNT_0049388149 /DNA_START=1 /DNA_END=152 /DNA_ORIENTATION=-